TTNGNGNGHVPGDAPAAPEESTAAVPQVPAPPVAKVHRPSGWRPPAESTTTPAIGTPQGRQLTGAPPSAAAATSGADIEVVDLRSDADLDAFVRALVHRFENPRDRMAIRSGKLRFRLGATAAGTAAPAQATTIRVEKGAVTERAVRDAAAQGAR